MSGSIDEILRELFQQYPDIKLAILFGSVASGNATAASDIDIGVMGDNPVSANTIIELMSSIGQTTGRPADVIDLKTAGEPILGQVFKGRRILGDKALYAALLSRHLIDSADFLPLQKRILKERRDAWTRR